MTAELRRISHPTIAACTNDSGSADIYGGEFGLPNPIVGSYNLLNLRAGYRFWRDKAEVAVSAFNALNDRHQEYPLGETIGSRVMGWLTVRF